MRIKWGYEIITLAQYFAFTLVSATVAIVCQARFRWAQHTPPEGLIADYLDSEVIKGSGVFYCWLIGLFLAFALLRLAGLFVVSRMSDRWGRSW